MMVPRESAPRAAAAPVSVVAPRSAAEWERLGVACPRCRRPLDDEAGPSLRCLPCDARYPVTCGIPDLRLLGDPYLSVAADVAAAETLAARSDGRDFGELYASYYDGNDKVSADQVARFTHGVLAAADRAGATLDTWREMGTVIPAQGIVVDLGCGTAPLAVTLARSGHPVLGVDAGLRWLVLARKRAAEAGIDLPVVCANAEHLPLRDRAAVALVGESVLENVTDADAAIAEGHRILGSGGVLALTTPNRHFVGPDPHLGMLAGGWRSPEAVRAYAARTGQVMPRRRLFAPGELSRALRQGGFRDVRLALPRFADAQRAGVSLPVNLAISGYLAVRRIPVLRSIVLQVAPTIAAVARST